jgi:hypothetical protein
MSVIGGSLTAPLIFILPPLFYTKMLDLERLHDEEEEKMKLLSDDENKRQNASKYGATVSYMSKETSNYISWLLNNIVRLVKSECTLSFVVIIFGIFATLTSTFYNIADVRDFQLWSPCIQNISLSYKMLSL